VCLPSSVGPSLPSLLLDGSFLVLACNSKVRNAVCCYFYCCSRRRRRRHVVPLACVVTEYANFIHPEREIKRKTNQ
jgi:hypothetical protein